MSHQRTTEQRGAPEAAGRRPDVSIVIPCRDAAHLIGAQLDALAREVIDVHAEVIVADNGSADGLHEVVAYHGDVPVRIVDASQRSGVNHARNVGSRHARADLILLCDADDVVRPGWLQAHMGAAASGCVLLGGPVEPFVHSPGDLEPRGRPAPADPCFGTLGFLPYPIGANCGYRREIFEALGGFDEDFAGGADEIDFFWRAQVRGHRLCHVAAASVWYRQRTARRARMRQARLAALGRARLYRKHRQNGWRRTNPLVGYARRAGRLLIDAPGAMRGGDALTDWLSRLAALLGHVEAAWKVGSVCP